MGGFARKDTPAERLRQFREMAAEAKQSAARTTNPEMRAGYLELAAAWEQLIREIESVR